MSVFDIMIFTTYKRLKATKKQILNHLTGLANKIFIFCIYSEYELIVDLFDCLYENIIIVFPVYTLSDYSNIFHSFFQTGISTSVDYYIIITNDINLTYLINNLSRFVFPVFETNRIIKLSHCDTNRDIYCLSYDIFSSLFKNNSVGSGTTASLTNCASTIRNFKDFLKSWKDL